MSEPGPRWLLLIHQIPPDPSYLRVKIGRRLQGLGAVAVKNSVYVLPRSDQALEDLQWVRREVVAGGGDATVCEARFLEGLSDAGVEALFGAARALDYEELGKQALALRQALARRGKRRGVPQERTGTALLRLRKRLDEVIAMDFFGASGRETVEGHLAAIESSLRPAAPARQERGSCSAGDVRGRTWVTRGGIQVDRMASAWLIRRFVDPEARFRFVAGREHTPAPGELRFDMFEAEFTHEGEQCTFEVLVRRFDLAQAGLSELAQIVHDVDLKDGKFARTETAGVERLLAGIALRHADDEARLADGAAVFDGLYQYFESRG